MFDLFNYNYYDLLLFLTLILFSLLLFNFFLIIILGIITPFIIKLANKDKDYKSKIFFIIYKKAISILFFLHIVLTSISILISIFRVYFEAYFIIFIITLIIGVVGIAIIYGICYFLDKNNIDKPNIKKIINMIIRIIFYIIIPIGIIALLTIFLYSIFRDFHLIINLGNSISLLIITVFVLLSISFLLFYFLAISKLYKNFISINSKLNKDNKSAFSSELETTKKDNNDNDYTI